jgi:formylglycine-generating enzyme required for sulfatase activity
LASDICQFHVTGTTVDSTISQVRDGIFEASESCHAGDTLLVSFAGHAILDSGELFLVWHSFHPDRVLQTALPARDVFMALNRSRATSKLLILDCCHAGAVLTPGFRAEAEVSLSEISAQASSFLMLLASDRLERAREVDSLGGGFLTTALCRALESGADADADGETSLSDAVTAIRGWTDAHNRAHPNEPVPIPLLVGKERGPVLLSRTPAWEPWSFHLGDVEMALVPLVRVTLIGRPTEVLAFSKHPITNVQYREFVSASADPRFEPAGYSFDREAMTWETPFRPWDDTKYKQDDLPVVCVNYLMARQYCAWLGGEFAGWRSNRTPSRGVLLGRRLSEIEAVDLLSPAQWSFAAYGTFEPHSLRTAQRRIIVRNQLQIHDKADMPAPIDQSGSRTNSLGVSDLFGNVWEWTLGHAHYAAPSISATRTRFVGDVVSGDGATSRTIELRGGGYLDDAATVVPYVRASELEGGLLTAHTDLGFRVVTLVDIASLPEPVAKMVVRRSVPLPADDRFQRLFPTGQ